MTIPRPPFDPEVGAGLELAAAGLPNGITSDAITKFRISSQGDDGRQLRDHSALDVEDVQIPSFDGELISVSITRPKTVGENAPCFVFAHGGGMILGDRWRGVEALIGPAFEHGAVIVTAEYRIAPEFPDPAPVQDCYATLQWTAANAERLGIDPARLIMTGRSAGGGLAAGVALLARDRGTPTFSGLLLMAPMLDDRDTTLSSRQYDGVGLWDRVSNRTGWQALLGDRYGTAEVPIYAAPSRAQDLTGLPPTYIEVGSAEVFRDECVDYANRIWQAGGDAELHVWAGAVHAFESIAPRSGLAADSPLPREGWIRRILARSDPRVKTGTQAGGDVAADHRRVGSGL